MFRVRFAPSPTGFLHLGGLRTALYDFLLARKNNGSFILRIEDTDVKRKIEGALEGLIKTLKIMGLEYDEGPFLNTSSEIVEKGKYGPYFQSKRLKLYQEVVDELIKKDKAYYCFCSQETLEQMKKEQMDKHLAPAYDKRCLKLSKEEVALRLGSKQPYVIRLKIPNEGKIKFNDLIRGEVEFDYKNIDDQVLIKSDGYPTYHLAVVVDDYLMKISHVIRGEEWLPSTPKHILIYQAMNWPLPSFAHLPLILNPGGGKLSKRQGDVAVEDYLSQGYLPEALINFIVLLGWSAQGGSTSGGNHEQEIFSLKELIKVFSLEKIQKAGAIFNREKLDWMNGYYIRKMEISELAKRCIPYLIQANLIEEINPSAGGEKLKISTQGGSQPKADGSRAQAEGWKITETGEEINFEWLEKIIKLEQERMKKLSDLPMAVDFFFKDKLDYQAQLMLWKKMDIEQLKENLNLIEEKIKNIRTEEFKAGIIQKHLQEIADKKGNGEIFWPLRVALSGKKASPPPTEIAEILGKENTLKRISDALKK